MSQGWGAAGGAILGSVFGGPAGAVVGAGIGAWLAGGSSTPEIPGEMQWLDDGDGLVMRLTASQVRADTVLVRVVSEDGALRKGRQPYFVDADGDFVLAVPWLPDHSAVFFLPHAATISVQDNDRVICLFVVNGQVTGFSSFAGIPRQRGERWSIADQIRPYVLLAMQVARADGVLDREEVRVIRQFFPQVGDTRRMREIMKERSNVSLERLVLSLAARLPDFVPGELLILLTTVARADGEVDAEERRVIAQVAALLGVPKEAWEQMLGDMPSCAPQGDEIDTAFAELGLVPPCTEQDIRHAYRKLARVHHPDRFMRHGEEAVAKATERTIQIRSAYELLVAAEAWKFHGEAGSVGGISPGDEPSTVRAASGWQGAASASNATGGDAARSPKAEEAERRTESSGTGRPERRTNPEPVRAQPMSTHGRERGSKLASRRSARRAPGFTFWQIYLMLRVVFGVLAAVIGLGVGLLGGAELAIAAAMVGFVAGFLFDVVIICVLLLVFLFALLMTAILILA